MSTWLWHQDDPHFSILIQLPSSLRIQTKHCEQNTPLIAGTQVAAAAAALGCDPSAAVHFPTQI